MGEASHISASLSARAQHGHLIWPTITEVEATARCNVAVLSLSGGGTSTAVGVEMENIVADSLTAAGHNVSAFSAIKNTEVAIRAQLTGWVADPEIDLVVVVGEAEATSRAMAPLVEQPLPGFADLLRMLAYEQIGASAMLSTADAARCSNGTFVFVLPSNEKAVRAAMEKLILPQLDPATTPTNLISAMPRLTEGTKDFTKVDVTKVDLPVTSSHTAVTKVDNVPAEVRAEQTARGSSPFFKLPAPPLSERARSHTGKNVVVVRKVEDPTKPIELQALEEQLEKSKDQPVGDATKAYPLTDPNAVPKKPQPLKKIIPTKIGDTTAPMDLGKLPKLPPGANADPLDDEPALLAEPPRPQLATPPRPIAAVPAPAPAPTGPIISHRPFSSMHSPGAEVARIPLKPASRATPQPPPEKATEKPIEKPIVEAKRDTVVDRAPEPVHAPKPIPHVVEKLAELKPSVVEEVDKVVQAKPPAMIVDEPSAPAMIVDKPAPAPAPAEAKPIAPVPAVAEGPPLRATPAPVEQDLSRDSIESIDPDAIEIVEPIAAKPEPAPAPRPNPRTRPPTPPPITSLPIARPAAEAPPVEDDAPIPIKPKKKIVGEAFPAPTTSLSDLPQGEFVYPTLRKKSKAPIIIIGLLLVGGAAVAAMMLLKKEDKQPAQQQEVAKPVEIDAGVVAAVEIDAAVVAAVEVDAADDEPIDIEPVVETPKPTPPPKGNTPKPPVQRGNAPKPPKTAITPKPDIEKPEPEKPDLPNSVKTPAPDPDGCDEVSCVRDNYARACCAKYKPEGGTFSPGTAGSASANLEKPQIKAGVDKMKARVIACGEQFKEVKGTVKLAMTVDKEGAVTDVSVQTAPDDALGECVATALRKARFAKTQNGGSFTYPFVF
jgi:molybdenum cofactor biosynthesis protein B